MTVTGDMVATSEPSDWTVVQVRLPRRWNELLRQLAQARMVSLSAVLREALREYYRRHRAELELPPEPLARARLQDLAQDLRDIADLLEGVSGHGSATASFESDRGASPWLSFPLEGSPEAQAAAGTNPPRTLTALDDLLGFELGEPHSDDEDSEPLT